MERTDYLNRRFNKRSPIYIQVMQNIKRQILYGEVKAGEELPSRRQLANDLKINPNTVQRAFSEMEEEGLIFTEPNRPSRVTENPKLLTKLKEEWVDEKITQFVADLAPIDLSVEEIVQVIEEKMQEREREDK